MYTRQKFQNNEMDVSASGEIYDIQPVNINTLNSLCADVMIGNVEAFEQVHEMLYPIFFNYLRLFSIDEKIIDQLLLDEFFYCWKNWHFISAAALEITLIKRIHNQIAGTPITDKNCSIRFPSAIPGTQSIANHFLMEYLELTEKEINLAGRLKVT